MSLMKGKLAAYVGRLEGENSAPRRKLTIDSNSGILCI